MTSNERAILAGIASPGTEVARLIVPRCRLRWMPRQSNRKRRCSIRAWDSNSIDALEMALAMSKAYNVKLRSDDERNHRIFSSLRSLAAHIEKHRTP